MVKFNGKYYLAGEEVPTTEKVVKEEPKEEKKAVKKTVKE